MDAKKKNTNVKSVKTTGNTTIEKPSSDSNTDKLVDIINDVLHPARRDEVFLNLNHQTTLVGTKSKKQIQKKSRKTKSKTLTRREYAQLGLYTLPTKAIKYNDMLPLHQLWTQYMREHLSLSDGIAPNVDDPSYDNFSAKLVKCDLHGAEMTVTRSKSPSLIGASGIVAMDTKNTFKLVGKDNRIRTIPKQDSVFQMRLDNLEFTIFGKHLMIRPAERSVKKIKTIMDLDL